MDALKQWMISIIFCSVTGAVINVLSPKGGTERVMKVVVASFMMCAFLSPFINGSIIDSSLVLPEVSFNTTDLSEEIADSMISQAKKYAVQEAETLLESLDVEYLSIQAEADVNSENQIYIKKIYVSADEKFDYRERQIESNLKESFSSEVIFEWVKN